MSQKELPKSTAQDYLQKAGTVGMEYLNIFKTKLTNTVVDTVYMAESITKTVLPGNPVTRDYEVTRHIGSAGPGLHWKLYAGFKKSTKQEATVFVLHKKNLESYSKKDRELVIEAFKKGATQLARIKHPRILSLQHQLEESKDSLAFATEPCFASLANVLGNTENMPSPLPSEFDNFKLLDVEMKYGLMQLAEGLSFLHKDVKILHRNICPESVIINQNGVWKLAGFELFVTSMNDPNSALKFPFKEWDGTAPLILNQPLEYLAPEYAISSSCDTASDMYSFGMLFYTVYNNGTTLYNCNRNYSTFVNHIELLKKTTSDKFEKIPSEVREYLKLLMHINPELRPDASQVMKIPFFDDVAVKTLEYLDSSFQVDNLQKSLFFKSLPQIIDKLPQRVCLQRIIPCLEQEFINPDMIPFLLPNIFLIADQSTNEEYIKYILPRLKVVFKLQKPVQILLIVLRNMSLILSKTPATDIKEHILPMFCRSLESDNIEIQELCLTTLPTFANLIDTQTIKLQLIPRIRKITLESPSLSLRVNSLVCIGKILEHLEKWIVLDDVLPILEKINVRDSAVLMAMLGIYKIVLTHPKLGITKDLLATRVIPFLIPITIDNNLNMQQFTAYMSLVKEMLTQIEAEQKKKLEQIEIMEREKSIIPYSFANSASLQAKQEVHKPPDTMMDQLMIGYGVTNASANTGAAQASYGNISPTSSTSINQPKKELTLAEKQQLAIKLEKENGTTTSTSSTTSLSSMKSSKSMTDSLMNKNLVDLTMSGQKTSNASNKSNNYDFAEFDSVLSSSSTPAQQQKANTAFNNSNRPAQFGTNTMNNFNGLNQFNMNNNSMSQMQRSSSSQQGFFGNLALPAPPTMTNAPTITSMNKNSTIPNLAPPPMKPLQPMINLSTSATTPNGSNTNTSKKSAIDDLNDLFG